MRIFVLIAAAVLCAAASSGCSSARSQVAQVQAEKEQLISAIEEQKKELDELKGRNEKLTAQLNEAEIEIARGPSYGERTLVAKSLEKNTPATTASETKQQLAAKSLQNNAVASGGNSAANDIAKKPENIAPAKTLPVPLASEVDSKLPWKPSRTEAATADAPGLKQWASQREWLKFNESSQSVQVNAALNFLKDGTTLANDTKARLDELAALLKSDAGKELRVMVAGPAPEAARGIGLPIGMTPADAVATYLGQQGVPRDRLGISATAEKSTDASAPRLSIHVLPGETPVIGWTPPKETTRR